MDGNLDIAPKHLVTLAARAALALSVALLGVAGSAVGQTIDVSLNLDYADNSDVDSGGTWQLAVKTSDFGLAGVSLGLVGINPPDATGIHTPSGMVNNGDDAGLFGQFATFPTLGYFGLVAGSNAPVAAGEQPWFYGIGSIIDPEGGSPNYPAQDPNTTSLGPSLTTLTNIENVPWGTGDFLGDIDWDHAAVLFSGTFAPGQTPGFFTDEDFENQGAVFTSLPAMASELGAKTDFFTVTTVVRSDFGVFADGDYNQDGTVNLADYTLWRDTLGSTVVPAGSGADGDLSGVIDAMDYDIWKLNFGTTPGSLVAGAATSAAVPEPQGVVITVFAATIVSLAAGRARRRDKRSFADSDEFQEKSFISGETA